MKSLDSKNISGHSALRKVVIQHGKFSNARISGVKALISYLIQAPVCTGISKTYISNPSPSETSTPLGMLSFLHTF